MTAEVRPYVGVEVPSSCSVKTMVALPALLVKTEVSRFESIWRGVWSSRCSPQVGSEEYEGKGAGGV